MGMDSNIKNGNRKLLVLYLGSCCLGGTLSGVVDKKPSNPKTFAKANPKVSKLSLTTKFKLGVFKQSIASRRKEAKEKLKRAFERSGAINMPMWKNIAEHEAEDRWNDLNKLIESIGGSEKIATNLNFVIPTVGDPRIQILKYLHKLFTSSEDDDAKRDLLKKFDPQTIVALLDYVPDEDKLLILICLSPFLRSIMAGHFIRTTPAIQDRLLVHLPTKERVLYFSLLEPDSQKMNDHLLPPQIQKRVQMYNSSQLLPDSEQIEL
ncbi:MAG: hypothetical protein K2L24_01760 [Opitutales bacterium]|nr:hypothetical protein [Opitutales bacterium]